ncbi:MAG: AAA family ATPase, partial [Erysipelotrichaceae bacterium]|nr:AAA family ATPase [Erysipelotrichaceae bacterium]
EVDGIGFTTADKLALSMGFDTEHPLRKEAAIVSAIMDTCMSTGDSYTDIETLSYRCSRLFGEWLNDIDEVLNRLIDKEKVVDEEGKLYHFTQYKAENDIANFFVTFPLRTFDHSDKDVDELLNDFEARIGIEYDDIQRQAVLSFFEDDVMILTGGPGTGKTTIVQGIIDVCKKRYPSYEIICCAPTGRAAKRMKEVTGNFATTIHALLKWNLETNTFGKNLTDPLLADVLIIDEFSMVDSWLMAQLALASGYVRKILFIGDEDQLPSVACGSVLRDLIASNRFKMVRLQHIYRQKEGSDVIQLAQHIKEGHFDEAMCKNDVRFFASKPYDVKDLILRIVDEAMLKGYRIQDIQVLAAKYSGPAGIDALNHALQKLCNPPGKQKRELQVGYRLYREGDKILQLKNQPDDDVFNGDIGILVEIVFASEDENNQNRLFVDFDGIIVEYTPEWFINITHAYCISVHKAQGSEYPIVIMAAIMEYGQMLQRRLMYTGITRASRSLILVGQKTAFEKAVSTVDKDTRKTYLRQRLIEVLS